MWSRVLTSLKPFICSFTHSVIQQLFSDIYLMPDTVVHARATGIEEIYIYIYSQPSTSLHTSGIEREEPAIQLIDSGKKK